MFSMQLLDSGGTSLLELLLFQDVHTDLRRQILQAIQGVHKDAILL